MCNCKNWCRDWQETNGGKYPPSEYAPGCEDYKTERFVRLEHDGTSCIMEPAEAGQMVVDSDCEYTITPVFLTRDQFERLDDFQGF